MTQTRCKTGSISSRIVAKIRESPRRHSSPLQARPFVKWAGGKNGLLDELRKLVPSSYERFFEPFLGGGAFFFDLLPKKAIISDSNSELMNAYIAVRDSPEELLGHLKQMPVNAETYYKTRDMDPSTLDSVGRAARLIYLNKTCYNGLYRVNKKGKFNTPYGKHSMNSVCRTEIIRSASKALRNVNILCDDFERILLQMVKAGDFVYLDPPYPPAGGYSDFVRYTRDFFHEEDHLRLAKTVEEIDNRGCSFILSNAKHPLIEELYSRFRKIDVEAPRYINCRGDKRGNVSELLVTNICTSQRTSLSTHQIHGKQTDLTTIRIQQSRQTEIRDCA